jgi:hypothetical protein
MSKCGTKYLGAEVYQSYNEVKHIYHTCKSRFCTRCGKKATTEWLRRTWRDLPEIPYVHVTVTMPKQFRELFRTHKEMERDLPALASRVIEKWAKKNFGASLFIVAVLQTYGKWITYNPHVHMLVSLGGLDETRRKWIESLPFPAEEPFEPIRTLWRDALTRYLLTVHKNGALAGTPFASAQFESIIRVQGMRTDWQVNIGKPRDRKKILEYAGRYMRHPPISNARIMSYTEDEVVFWVKRKPTKAERASGKKGPIKEPVHLSLKEFIDRLVLHVQTRYRHGMRFFGLLTPRRKKALKEIVFQALGQPILPSPGRQSFREMCIKEFGVDPFLDPQGMQMEWKRRLPAQRE